MKVDIVLLSVEKNGTAGYALVDVNKRTDGLNGSDVIVDEYEQMSKFVDLSFMGLGYGNFRKVYGSTIDIFNLPVVNEVEIKKLFDQNIIQIEIEFESMAVDYVTNCWSPEGHYVRDYVKIIK